MNVISKEDLEKLLIGFTATFETSEHGGIVYWQSKGAINLLKSMLAVYYP